MKDTKQSTGSPEDMYRALKVAKLKNVLVEAGVTAANAAAMDDGQWALTWLAASKLSLPSQKTRDMVVRALRDLESREIPKTPPEAFVAYAWVPLKDWGTGKVKLPRDWSNFGKRVTVKGERGNAYLTIHDKGRSQGRSTHLVRLDAGEWPTDEELLSICDGTVPPVTNHFGGRISKIANSNERYVTVYTD